MNFEEDTKEEFWQPASEIEQLENVDAPEEYEKQEKYIPYNYNNKDLDYVE